MKLVDITEGRNFPQRKDFAQVVKATMKAAQGLSDEAKIAISTWQSSNWHLNAMQRDHTETGGTGVFGEIYAAFGPVRQLINQLYGQTIELHRGIKMDGRSIHIDDRTMFSWTLDLDTANSFAGFGRGKKSETLTPEQIDALVDRYNKTGYVFALGYQLIRNKYSPEYFNIWKNRQSVTDGDDIKKFITGVNNDRLEWNNRGNEKGRVTTKAIPVESLVWMAHELGSAEFIVLSDAG